MNNGIRKMAHSPLINCKRYNSNYSNSYYGTSIGSNFQSGNNYRHRSYITEPISVQRFYNQPTGINRYNANVSLNPHHISTGERRGPLRADHNIRVNNIYNNNSNNKTDRKQQNISSFTPLNRRKSGSLNSLTSDSSSSSSNYRTLFDRISNERSHGTRGSFSSSVTRDGEAILQNAKMKLEKLNKDYWTKPLTRRYSSMSDISTRKEHDVNNNNTVNNEFRDNLDIKSLNKKSNKHQQESVKIAYTINRASTDVVHNRNRRQSVNNIDDGAICYTDNINKTISSGLQSKPSSPPPGPAENKTTNHHMSSESTSKSSIEEQNYGDGIVGLRNLGNTCFMNSILQCLCKSKELRTYFFNKDYRKDINEQFKPTRGRLTIAFGDFMHDLWSSSKGVTISPSQLKSEVEKFAPTFIGTHQHDSQEFLRFFIEGIHDELNSIKCKPTFNNNDDSGVSDDEKVQTYWKQYISREKSVIQGLFVGQLRSTLKCSSCDHCSVTYDPFWDLSLPITVKKSGWNVDIIDCFKTFTQEETLGGDEKPTCERCKKRRKCTKRFLIQKYPKILVIHLKRFSGHRFRTKLSTKVLFPMELNINEFVVPSSESREAPVYNLFGVSNHIGGTGSGHYTAYCKHPDTSKWHLFNDSRVSEVSSSDVVSSSAYVLFYSLSSSNG